MITSSILLVNISPMVNNSFAISATSQDTSSTIVLNFRRTSPKTKINIILFITILFLLGLSQKTKENKKRNMILRLRNLWLNLLFKNPVNITTLLLN